MTSYCASSFESLFSLEKFSLSGMNVPKKGLFKDPRKSYDLIWRFEWSLIIKKG